MEQNDIPGGKPEQASGGADQVVQESPGGPGQVSGGNKSHDGVSYDSYSKALDEKKLVQSRLSEAQRKLEALQGKQLQQEGKKDEYIVHLENQIKQERETRLDDRATFAHRALSERIMSEAGRLGCVDPKAVLKLAELDRVSIGDDLTIDDTSVKLMMEDMKKNMPYLFKTQAIPAKDGAPVTKMEQVKDAGVKPKTMDELSGDEFQAAFREQMKKTLG